MKRANELDGLFSDARLEPDKRFVRDLRKQLTKPKRRLELRVLVPATGLLAVLLVIGLVLVRPTVMAPSKKSKSTQSEAMVLLSKLYSTATADALPQQSANTFWKITDSNAVGPAAAACNVSYDAPDTPPAPFLLFKDGNVTASWGRGWNGLDTMRYSEDPEMPAFDPDSLQVSQDLSVGYNTTDTQLTDQNGKPLPNGAKTTRKTTGSYDLYATQTTRSKGGAYLIPNCPTRFIHLRVDAATGIYTEMDSYNGTMADDKLASKETRTIVTGAGNFAAELPQFTAVGFNLEEAKKQQAQVTTAHVINKAAGYSFLYRWSLMGRYSMTEIKAGSGVAAYSYHFSKEPKVVYRVYTAQSSGQEPKDMAALQALAQAKGWQVITDIKNSGSDDITDAQGPATETYIASDGTTEYGMYSTGVPTIPYVYAEAPGSNYDIMMSLNQITVTTLGN